MKKLILALASLLPSAAFASPYFRGLDLNSPHTSLSAYVDPSNPGNTAAGTSLALITHSPVDGCLFPEIVCENWSPLAVDYAANSGHALFGFGPSANLAPTLRNLAARGIRATSLPDTYVTAAALARILEEQNPTMDVAFGPKWMICPEQNWKGYFRIQAGVAWRW